MLDVKIKLLYEDSLLPIYATDGSAGLDCFVHDWTHDELNNAEKCKLGFAIEIPKGYVGLLFPRSSVYDRHLTMANCVGVIDSDYRGEVQARFYLGPNENNFYTVGERCAQLIIVPYPKINFIISDYLTNTERGEGGHGSTGTK